MKILKCTGIYKDGGSRSYIDNNGQKYWLNNQFKHKDKGKLFLGNINDKEPILAKGHFCLKNLNKEDIYIFQLWLLI